jgi:hypothetical protein
MNLVRRPGKKDGTQAEFAFDDQLGVARPTAQWVSANQQEGRRTTLWSMAARAQAVYAPREKPNIEILSPAVSGKQHEQNEMNRSYDNSAH